MGPFRRTAFALLFGAAVLAPGLVSAKTPGSIEVVEVKGIIDGSVERAITRNLEQAERDAPALVVLQIDSRGVVDATRTRRIVGAVARSDVPVAAWVGPPGARAEHGAARIVEAARIRRDVTRVVARPPADARPARSRQRDELDGRPRTMARRRPRLERRRGA